MILKSCYFNVDDESKAEIFAQRFDLILSIFFLLM